MGRYRAGMLLLALLAWATVCMAFVDDGPRQMGSDKRSSQPNRCGRWSKRRESLDLNERTPMGWLCGKTGNNKEKEEKGWMLVWKFEK